MKPTYPILCKKFFWIFLGLTLALSIAQAKELKSLEPRAPFSALTLPDLAGKTHRLADYQGKVVLVNFWATWCPPCRAEMPSMQRLKARMAGKPFVILAVNMAENEADIRDFLKEMKPTKIDFTILMDPQGKTIKEWRVSVFPTSFIIDATGNLRYSLLGATEWDEYDTVQKIEALLPPQRTKFLLPAALSGATKNTAARRSRSSSHHPR